MLRNSGRLPELEVDSCDETNAREVKLCYCGVNYLLCISWIRSNPVEGSGAVQGWRRINTYFSNGRISPHKDPNLYFYISWTLVAMQKRSWGECRLSRVKHAELRAKNTTWESWIFFKISPKLVGVIVTFLILYILMRF